MLYGSKISGDILGEEMLTKWTANYGDSFSVTHVLSDESESSEWKGERGYITEPLIREKLPSPVLGDDAIIFVCGPPPMYEALCGPRGESEIKGVLADMGYKKNQVYKF
uniref:Oxidoreductase FAD/NAD(P)-binding domain-containing protein n=2 Tax=Odontella aurita TaxID=265563 RepID=A0A7S4IVV7_9STRA|mmetsp:Transcript_31201/g.93546  ORF Transcript_31201/g.93546 Transcript_31201/m.93546 type:complete len:109 (+) Transcript_31201:115-441(+)